VFWHTLRYTIGMGTNGAPMVETNLETVRNPTNLFVGGCQNRGNKEGSLKQAKG